MSILAGSRGFAVRIFFAAGGVPAVSDSQRKQERGKFMVVCPECDSDIDVDAEEVDEGEIVSCPECGSDFEVVTTEPLELTKVEDEYEDDDDEEEEEEEGDD
jgi:alpha-aminoadipate/glutamate carrier protein LysW